MKHMKVSFHYLNLLSHGLFIKIKTNRENSSAIFSFLSSIYLPECTTYLIMPKETSFPVRKTFL